MKAPNTRFLPFGTVNKENVSLWSLKYFQVLHLFGRTWINLSLFLRFFWKNKIDFNVCESQSIILFFFLYFIHPLSSIISSCKKIGRGMEKGEDKSLQNLVILDVILHNREGEG